MRKLYALLIVLSFSANAQIVNIPDPIFKAALLNYTPAIDTNADGEIQLTEAQAITTLEFQTLYDVIDMTGIKSFSNLQTLNTGGAYNLVTLDLSGMSNLQHLNLRSSYDLTSINLSGLTALTDLNLSDSYVLTTIDFAGLNALKEINCEYCDDLTSATINTLPNLETVNFSGCSAFTTLDASGLTNLKTLNCKWSYHLASVNVSGCTALEVLDVSNCSFTALDVSGLSSLQDLDCSMNAIPSLNVGALTNLQKLNCSDNQLTSLDVANLINLTLLACNSNQIATIAVGSLVNLVTLDVRYNLINSLDLNNLVLLENLNAGGNQLSSLDLSSLSNLKYLDCHSNLLTALDLSAQHLLENIDCGQNQIATLDVSPIINANFLACSGNSISSLDVTMLPLLERLICSNNQLSNIDLSQNPVLRSIQVGGNLFTELDFSHTGTEAINNGVPLYYYSIENNPNLTYVNVKNGANQFFGSIMAFGSSNLAYICADENNIQYILDSLESDNLTNVQVNSYCSFTPNGNHNIIAGTVTLDLNNNGCTAGDSHFSDMKIGLNDGTTTGATFTNASGNYTFYTMAGDFTLTPQFDNPYFTVSPASAVVNFATSDNLSQTQNFCLAPNGIHNDLEVTLIPTTPARPGFDAHYQLTYKNKGNQTMSGTVSMDYNDSVLDLVTSAPMPDDQATGYMEWDFTNLLPFETRNITFTMNVNSPLESPAVEIGDVLNFIAVINPDENDETPIDNLAKLEQIVVGSFDPNDKTCLEGTTMTPQMVGEYLHYVIRFQNSGTFYAENVIVKDVIDATKFDISTLQLTGSSHPHITRINGNKVEFIFEGINLPAEEDDEPGSHGFVAFKIKTKPNLALGDAVTNIADIFFDFNAPITTLPATTTVSLLAVNQYENTSVSISPNPVKSLLSISARDNITSIQLFDVQGRLLQTSLESQTSATLDFTGKTSGIYFVKVYTDKGMKVQKVIKE